MAARRFITPRSFFSRICLGLLILSQSSYAASPLELQYAWSGGNVYEPTSYTTWESPPDKASDFLKAFGVIDAQKSPQLKITDESAALVYARATSLVAEEFGEKLQSGILPFKRYLYAETREGYLGTLKELYARNGRQRIVIQIPQHEVLSEMIPAVNADLQNVGWGEFVEFRVDSTIVVKLDDAFPGKQHESLTKWNKTRSLLVPILSISAAYLGVMAEQVFSNPHFLAVQEGLVHVGRAGESGVTQLEAAMRLGPVFLGTAATVAATLGLKKLSKKSQVAIAEGRANFADRVINPIGQKMNSHTIIGLSAAATLGGTAALLGSDVVSTLIQIGMLMGAAYGLEWQFSKYSKFWDKYAWRAGWVDFVYRIKLMPKVAHDQIKKFPKLTGFVTNWGVNTLYPLGLFGSLALGATVAEHLNVFMLKVGGPSLGNPYPYADVIEGALMNGLAFSTAFGLFQVMIGSLKQRFSFSESARYKAETSAVAYNQVGRVLDAGGAAVGGWMLWGFAAVVTMPTVAASLLQDKVLKRYDRKTRNLVAMQCAQMMNRLAR